MIGSKRILCEVIREKMYFFVRLSQGQQERSDWWRLSLVANERVLWKMPGSSKRAQFCDFILELLVLDRFESDMRRQEKREGIMKNWVEESTDRFCPEKNQKQSIRHRHDGLNGE